MYLSCVHLRYSHLSFLLFFFSHDTTTTQIYTLSLHDALPIYRVAEDVAHRLHHADLVSGARASPRQHQPGPRLTRSAWRSEEHTSELQSLTNLVCRLLLEKKKKKQINNHLRT